MAYDVDLNARRKRKRRRAERARMDTLPSAETERKRQRSSTFTFKNVSNERWEKCFGKWTPEVFRKAKEEQDRKKAEGQAQTAKSAAVHGDNKGAGRRMYRGFDWGLGRHIEGRSDRRQAMQELGLREAR